MVAVAERIVRTGLPGLVITPVVLRPPSRRTIQLKHLVIPNDVHQPKTTSHRIRVAMLIRRDQPRHQRIRLRLLLNVLEVRRPVQRPPRMVTARSRPRTRPHNIRPPIRVIRVMQEFFERHHARFRYRVTRVLRVRPPRNRRVNTGTKRRHSRRLHTLNRYRARPDRRPCSQPRQVTSVILQLRNGRPFPVRQRTTRRTLRSGHRTSHQRQSTHHARSDRTDRQLTAIQRRHSHKSRHQFATS